MSIYVYKAKLFCFVTQNKKKMSSRSFCGVVTGIIYPGVQAGATGSNGLLPEWDPDRNYYHHPVIKVNERDIKQWNNLRNKPVRLEHGQHQGSQPVEVGIFVDGVITNEQNLHVTAGLYDTEAGRYAHELIKNGVLKGFSIGYDPIGDTNGYLVEKVLNEGSLVVKPFFPGANISVCASDSPKYNNEAPKNTDRLFVPFTKTTMADNIAPTPASASVNAPPPTPTPTNAGVNALSGATGGGAPAAAAAPQRDATTEIQLRAMELELKQMREERARQEKEKGDLEKKYQEQEAFTKKYLEEKQKQREQEETKELALAKEAMARIQKGLGADQLPPEYVEQQLSLAQKKVYTDIEDPARGYLDVAASMTQKIANRFSDMQTEQQKLVDELAKLKSELQDRDKRLLSVADRLHGATQNSFAAPMGSTAALGGVTTSSGGNNSSSVSVNASGANGGGGASVSMTDLLVVPKVRPNTREGYMYQQLYGSKQPMSVQASFGETQTVTVPAPPVHDKMAYCKNSLRNRKDEAGNPVGAAWFSTIVNNWRPDMKSKSNKFAVSGDMKTERTF